MKKIFVLTSLIVVALVIGACTAAPTPAPTAAPPTAAPVAQATTVPTAAPAATTAPAATAAPAGTVAPTPVVAKGRLATVLGRGRLVCGVNGELAGFATLEASGDYSGIDAEFCRAMAAALFNDAKKVDFRKVNTTERFTAIQSGEVDVVFRNTTFTLNRDSAVGMEFGPTTFYDGGGMMVPKKNNIKKLEDLNGASICVLTGTTNEQVLNDVFKAKNIKFTPKTFQDAPTLYKTYDTGGCDAATSDKSQLAGQRASLLSKPDDHMIMDDTLSKEPLGPMVASNDSQWRDVMTWVVYATFYAEEAGITSKNVDDMLKSDDTNIKRFLGATGNLGKDMAITNDAFYRVIKLVGNYGEIFDKTLGPNTKFNVPRGLNQPYTKGGLQYSPPFR